MKMNWFTDASEDFKMFGMLFMFLTACALIVGTLVTVYEIRKLERDRDAIASGLVQKYDEKAHTTIWVKPDKNQK